VERGGAGAREGVTQRQACRVSYAPTPAVALARSSQRCPADSLDGQEEHDDAGAAQVESANGMNRMNGVNLSACDFTHATKIDAEA
jgi:hypothetical protein